MYKKETFLSPGSHKKVDIICDDCRIEFNTENRQAVKTYKRFSRHLCKKCAIRDHGRNNMTGDKNVMRRNDVRKRASETRKRKFKEDPEFCKQHAEMTKKSWADGKHADTQVGRCKWYDYTKKDGSVVKCQVPRNMGVGFCQVG
jgi:hypothetical protein